MTRQHPQYLLLIAALLATGSAFADPLVATYQVSTTTGEATHSARFLFARDETTVAFIDARKTYRDVWDVSVPGQQLRLRRVVDIRRATIEFLPSELTLRGHLPRWESLQSPFGSDVVGNCATHSAQVVACVAGDTLPAAVTLRFGATEVRWVQTSLVRDREAFARATRVDDDYSQWDAADFGDQEYDRELQALLPYAELDPHHPRIHAANDRTSPADHTQDGRSHDGHRH